MRVLPKLMSEQSEMFRFFSCKFRLQQSKLKTARVVLWREFNIVNCFTLEASFQGYFDSSRKTIDFEHSHFSKIGIMLAKSFFEYVIMKEEEERQVHEKRRQKNDRKKIMTPSGSSEDNLEPPKLTHIRKKLLNA
jgi:cytosolic carboxypeptidase protein 2/3